MRPRSGEAGGRSYPTPLRPRPGAAARRSRPTPVARGSGREDQPHTVAAWAQEAQRSYPTLKVRKDSGEEIPLVQGKEHWLRFAGPAIKRHPTPKVRETQVKR